MPNPVRSHRPRRAVLPSHEIRGQESILGSSFGLGIATVAPTVEKTTPVPLLPPPVRSEQDAEENNQPRILLGTFPTRYEPSDILMDRSVPPDLAPGHFWGILRRRISHAGCSDAVGQAGVSSDYHSSLRCSRSCAWPRLTTGRQGGARLEQSRRQSTLRVRMSGGTQ